MASSKPSQSPSYELPPTSDSSTKLALQIHESHPGPETGDSSSKLVLQIRGSFGLRCKPRFSTTNRCSVMKANVSPMFGDIHKQALRHDFSCLVWWDLYPKRDWTRLYTKKIRSKLLLLPPPPPASPQTPAAAFPEPASTAVKVSHECRAPAPSMSCGSEEARRLHEEATSRTQQNQALCL